MSPILSLQRRLVEVGRIRMGEKRTSSSGKRYPAKLSTFRLTSKDEARIRAIAELYGGTPRSWDEREGEWEVTTETAELPIVLMPGHALSQHFELWGSPGAKKPVQCLRRCDGERELLSDGPCKCPAADDERAELAKKGEACRPTTRLSVILPDVPGLGTWRLETHGWYAAVELAGTATLLEEITRKGALFPARLRLEERRQVLNGETVVFAVPVVDVDATFRQTMAVAGSAAQGEIAGPPPAVAELGPAREYAPLEREQGPDVSQAVEETRKAQTRKSGRSAAPMPDAGVEPSTDPFGPPTEDDEVPNTATAEKPITNAQRRMLFARARELELDEPAIRAAVKAVTGDESTKSIERDQFETVLSELEKHAKGVAA